MKERPTMPPLPKGEGRGDWEGRGLNFNTL